MGTWVSNSNLTVFYILHWCKLDKRNSYPVILHYQPQPRTDCLSMNWRFWGICLLKAIIRGKVSVVRCPMLPVAAPQCVHTCLWATAPQWQARLVQEVCPLIVASYIIGAQIECSGHNCPPATRRWRLAICQWFTTSFSLTSPSVSGRSRVSMTSLKLFLTLESYILKWSHLFN